MPELKLILSNRPVPQGRPRVGKWGVWDPNKDIKNWTRIQFQEQVSSVIDQPCKVSMKFYMQIPKSMTKKNLSLIASGNLPHTKKPDIDNLVILVLNCMNQIVFVDDRLVYELSASKEYSPNPHTEVIVSWKDLSQEKNTVSGRLKK